MGRAPGTALAYMYWYKGFQLMEAHKHLTGLRACNPKLTAIRSATCDILFDGKGTAPIRIAVSRSKAGLAQRVQVALASNQHEFMCWMVLVMRSSALEGQTHLCWIPNV